MKNVSVVGTYAAYRGCHICNLSV